MTQSNNPKDESKRNQRPLKPSKKGLFWVAVVVAVLAVSQMVFAFVADGRIGVGALFYSSSEVQEHLDYCRKPVQSYVAVCENQQVESAFDSVSLKRLEAWCHAAETLAEDPSDATASDLLKAEKKHLDFIMERLITMGDPWAEFGLSIMQTKCEIRSDLERINSIRAGAAFSQFLAGIILLVVAFVVFRRSIKPES